MEFKVSLAEMIREISKSGDEIKNWNQEFFSADASPLAGSPAFIRFVAVVAGHLKRLLGAQFGLIRRILELPTSHELLGRMKILIVNHWQLLFWIVSKPTTSLRFPFAASDGPALSDIAALLEETEKQLAYCVDLKVAKKYAGAMKIALDAVSSARQLFIQVFMEHSYEPKLSNSSFDCVAEDGRLVINEVVSFVARGYAFADAMEKMARLTFKSSTKKPVSGAKRPRKSKKSGDAGEQTATETSKKPLVEPNDTQRITALSPIPADPRAEESETENDEEESEQQQ